MQLNQLISPQKLKGKEEEQEDKKDDQTHQDLPSTASAIEVAEDLSYEPSFDEKPMNLNNMQNGEEYNDYCSSVDTNSCANSNSLESNMKSKTANHNELLKTGKMLLQELSESNEEIENLSVENAIIADNLVMTKYRNLTR